jgi:L-alanine-DL-glutamate epimerase-like enolase superfamily enzyme
MSENTPMGRREFVKGPGAAAFSLGLLRQSAAQGEDSDHRVRAIREAETSSVLADQYIQSPVTITSIELLHLDGEFLVRMRSKEGLESVTAPNSLSMKDCYPIFLNRVAPWWIGKDACRIESLMPEFWRASSNYKLQGLSFWVAFAAFDIGALDLIGKQNGVPLGALFGPVRQTTLPVYFASSNRGNTPEEELESLRSLAAESGAKALKIRLGGRMSRDADFPPDRTDRLVPLVRRSFPDFTLYGDANGSYGWERGVEVGRLLKEHGYAFYEEPCPFDDLWMTKAFADELEIPIAGGEQESSLTRFRWMIESGAVDAVQPDLHYFGGLIRSAKVARMAAAAGMKCIPHISGSGVGHVTALQFSSSLPNPGDHLEYKGGVTVPAWSSSSALKAVNGQADCPTEPGLGVTIDPAFVRKCQVVTTL